MTLKKIKTLSGFSLGFFAFRDIFNFIELIVDIIAEGEPYATINTVAQGIYVLGIVCIVIFYYSIINNIEKKGLFIPQNKRKMLIFGCILLVCSFSSSLLFNWYTDNSDAASRMLGIIGSLLIFSSFIFKSGFSLKEEQDLII